MLFTAIPYIDSIQLGTPPMFYPISYVVPYPVATARERYLRSVAEVARERYLRELEEQRLLESLRRQEALRAELRHQEAVSQALLRHRQGQGPHARRYAPRPISGSYGHPPTFRAPFCPENARAPSGIEQRTDPILTVEDLLSALIGGDDQEVTEDLERHAQQVCTPIDRAPFCPENARAPSGIEQRTDPILTVEDLLGALIGGDDQEVTEDLERHAQQAHANQARRLAVQEARARFLSKLDAIKEETQAVHNSCAPGSKSRPITSNHPRDDKPALFSCTPPLTRRAEIPRNRDRRDRAARTIQRHWFSHSADIASLKDALTTINVLRARFKFLREAFTFPEHLDFKKDEKDGSEIPQLSYSPLNAGVHSYMNELTKLLTNADAVPSGGDERVRSERRAFVQSVEAQLQALEERMHKVWGQRRAGASRAEDQNEDSTVHPTEARQTAERVPVQQGLSDSVAQGEVVETIGDSTVEYAETPVDISSDVHEIPVESSAGHESGPTASPSLPPVASDDQAPSSNVSPSSPKFISQEDLPQLPPYETVASPDERDAADPDKAPPTVSPASLDRDSASVLDEHVTATAIETRHSGPSEHIVEVTEVSLPTEEVASTDAPEPTRAPPSPPLSLPVLADDVPSTVDSSRNDEVVAVPTSPASPDLGQESYNIVYPESDSRSETPIGLDDDDSAEVVDLGDDYRQDVKDVEGKQTAQEDEEFEVL